MPMKQIGSVITTSQKAASSQTSTELTRIGAVTLSDSQQIAALTRLTTSDDKPEQITRKVIKCVESSVTLQTKLTKDYEIAKFELGDISPEGLQKAYQAALQSCVALPTSDIEQRLTAMIPLLTLPANMDQDMMILKITSLAKELGNYPADIVLHAIEQIKRTSKFFPTFAEFYEVIGWRYRPRKLLLETLQKRIDSHNEQC